MCYDLYEPAPPPKKLLVVRATTQELLQAFPDWDIIIVLAKIPQKSYDVVVMGTDLHKDKEWVWYHGVLAKASKNPIAWTA